MIVCKEAVSLLQQACGMVDESLAVIELPLEERYAQWERILAYDIGQASEFALKAYVFMNGHIPTRSHNHQDIVKECKGWGLHKYEMIESKLPVLYFYQKCRYNVGKPIQGDKVIEVLRVLDNFVSELWDEYMPVVFEYCKSLPPVYSSQVTERGLPEEVVMCALPHTTSDDE